MNLKAHCRNIEKLFVTIVGISALVCTMGGVALAAADPAQEPTVVRLSRELKALQEKMDLMVSVPVGTIMAYGGDLREEKNVTKLKGQGWLPCDGAEISSAIYKELFDAIGTAFGGDKVKSTFNVPDLRGRFARGVDSGTKNDLDAASRQASAPGGNAGDQVGSIQDDQFKTHRHTIKAAHPGRAGGRSTGDPSAVAGWPTNPADKEVEATGGAETRPKNIYVNWIIKAKHTLPMAP